MVAVFKADSEELKQIKLNIGLSIDIGEGNEDYIKLKNQATDLLSQSFAELAKLEQFKFLENQKITPELINKVRALSLSIDVFFNTQFNPDAPLAKAVNQALASIDLVQHLEALPHAKSAGAGRRLVEFAGQAMGYKGNSTQALMAMIEADITKLNQLAPEPEPEPVVAPVAAKDSSTTEFLMYAGFDDKPTVVQSKSGEIKIVDLTDMEGRPANLINLLKSEKYTKDQLCLLKADGSEVDLKSLPNGLTGDERMHIGEDIILVNKGDLFDHGPYDLRLAKIFENTAAELAKNQQSHRYVMLGGNRDYNKLRFQMELNETSIDARIKYNDVPSWAANIRFAELVALAAYKNASTEKPHIYEELSVAFSKTVDLNKFKETLNKVATEMKNAGNPILKDWDGTSPLEEKYIKEVVRFTQSEFDKPDKSIPPLREQILGLSKNMEVTESNPTLTTKDTYTNDQARELLYLKWMLKETMGCGVDPDPTMKEFHTSTFNFRRQEIAAMSGKEVKFVSDLDVYNTFADPKTYKPTIEQCKVAVVVEQTDLAKDPVHAGRSLYIHGGLTENSFMVNGKDYFDEPVADWIGAINKAFHDAANDVYQDKIDQNLPATMNLAIRATLQHGTSNVMSMLNQYPKDIQDIIIKNQEVNADRTSTTITQFLTQQKDVDKVTIDNKALTPEKSVVPQRVIDYLKKNGITRVLYGHTPMGDDGVSFIQDGIEFVNTDNTRTANQEEALCSAEVKMSSGINSSVQVTAHDKILGAVTLLGACQGVKFKAAEVSNRGLIEPGVPGKQIYPVDYTMQIDQEGQVIFLGKAEFTYSKAIFTPQELIEHEIRLRSMLEHVTPDLENAIESAKQKLAAVAEDSPGNTQTVEPDIKGNSSTVKANSVRQSIKNRLGSFLSGSGNISSALSLKSKNVTPQPKAPAAAQGEIFSEKFEYKVAGKVNGKEIPPENMLLIANRAAGQIEIKVQPTANSKYFYMYTPYALSGIKSLLEKTGIKLTEIKDGKKTVGYSFDETSFNAVKNIIVNTGKESVQISTVNDLIEILPQLVTKGLDDGYDSLIKGAKVVDERRRIEKEKEAQKIQDTKGARAALEAAMAAKTMQRQANVSPTTPVTPAVSNKPNVVQKKKRASEECVQY